MNLFRKLFGVGLRGELTTTQIALGVARGIADDWKARATEAQSKIIALSRENERLKAAHEQLTETHEQQQRCAGKLATALGRVTPMINR